MLFPALALALPFLLQAPGYTDEALRVERHSAWDRQVQAVVVRNVGSSTLVDYIDTTWSGSDIATFDLTKCPILQRSLVPERGPKAFASKERTADGGVVIHPDGPAFTGAAKAPYRDLLGAERIDGNMLTPFGQWADVLLEAANLCRP